MSAEGTIAYIGLGANLRDPLGKCQEAIDLLRHIPGVKVLRISSFYRTEPFGVTDQDDFVNAACEIRVQASARQLLTVLKDIEHQMGRRTERRWGPRIIDLDLLLYGQDVIDDGDLVVPHPECHKRRFVLVPLCEIASYALHPAFGISIKGLLDRLPDMSRVELIPMEN